MAKTIRELQREIADRDKLLEETIAKYEALESTAGTLNKRVEDLQTKVVELTTRDDTRDKTIRNLIERRNALRNHIKIAISTCARGRKQRGRRTRAMRQAQSMLEAALDEDDYLDPNWAIWSKLSPVMIAGITSIMGVLPYVNWMAGFKGTKA